ncbi:AAA domain-containing protein [Paenibacillus sp. FSL M7-1455]|uniref:AAA domain-containing protein n=1 Tax=Paenibacillus sp. FSL M7-1455 TaxID=2975316 RepID=UPI0030FBB15C
MQSLRKAAFRINRRAVFFLLDPDSVLKPLSFETSYRERYACYKRTYSFRYNLSQRTALDQALKSAISIVEGPPGTGRTQTILNILADLAIMERT